MKVWVDAQTSPHFAVWMRTALGVDAYSVFFLGLADESDRRIFEAARAEKAVVITKDVDFVDLVARHGSPPHVIWVTCGNTSNTHLRGLFQKVFEPVSRLILSGEPVVEVMDILP